MRICIADYSGHPFQVQLSRELARRGHNVLHLHFSEFQTPKGRLQIDASDPSTLEIEPISLGRPFAKYQFVKRRQQEVEVGKLFVARIARHNPDVVIACNLPLDALNAVRVWSKAGKHPLIFWQQDIYSKAINDILSRKLGLLGRIIGTYYRHLERIAARDAAAVVVIADDFKTILERQFGIVPQKIHVVENWAPIDEITPHAKANSWSVAHNLAEKTVVLYTGTIGMKHNPAQILALAKEVNDRADTAVVIVSEGPAAEWLREEAAKADVTSLQILPFQPFNIYSDVLASSDVLISILEAEAGVFSVPSKVLSYLCAERAIVLSAPPENLASRIIRSSDAGIAVAAGDTDGFVHAVTSMLGDAEARRRHAKGARAYADRTFNIGAIGDRFEAIIKSVAMRPAG